MTLISWLTVRLSQVWIVWVILTYHAAPLQTRRDFFMKQDRCCVGVCLCLCGNWMAAFFSPIFIEDVFMCVCPAGAGLLQLVWAVWAGCGQQWELAQSPGASSVWTRTTQSSAGPMQGEWNKVFLIHYSLLSPTFDLYHLFLLKSIFLIWFESIFFHLFILISSFYSILIYLACLNFCLFSCICLSQHFSVSIFMLFICSFQRRLNEMFLPFFNLLFENT